MRSPTPPRLVIRALAIAAALSAPACTGRPPTPTSEKSEPNQETPVSQPTSPSAPPSTAPEAPAPAPAPGCSATLRLDGQSAEGARLVAVLRNDGPAPLYLLHAGRMPYVLVEGADQIVLAWSIQPLPDDRDLGAIQALDTAVVPAGGELRREATLRLPLQVSTHVSGPAPYKGQLPAAVKVVAELGLVSQALDPKERHRQRYAALLADQRICRSAPVTVTLGKP